MHKWLWFIHIDSIQPAEQVQDAISYASTSTCVHFIVLSTHRAWWIMLMSYAMGMPMIHRCAAEVSTSDTPKTAKYVLYVIRIRTQHTHTWVSRLIRLFHTPWYYFSEIWFSLKHFLCKWMLQIWHYIDGLVAKFMRLELFWFVSFEMVCHIFFIIDEHIAEPPGL